MKREIPQKSLQRSDILTRNNILSDSVVPLPRAGACISNAGDPFSFILTGGLGHNCIYPFSPQVFSLSNSKWITPKVNFVNKHKNETSIPDLFGHTATYFCGGLKCNERSMNDKCSDELNYSDQNDFSEVSKLLNKFLAVPFNFIFGGAVSKTPDQGNVYSTDEILKCDDPHSFQKIPISPTNNCWLMAAVFSSNEVSISLMKLNFKKLVPPPRFFHASVIYDNKYVIVQGGFDGNSVLSDSWILDIENMTWFEVENRFVNPNRNDPTAFNDDEDYIDNIDNMKLLERKGHTISYDEDRDRYLLIGGRQTNMLQDPHVILSGKLTYNNEKWTILWSKIYNDIQGTPMLNRMFHSAAFINKEQLLIVGGQTAIDLSDSVILNVQLNRWIKPLYEQTISNCK